MAVPLVDVDLETGPTGVWLGSHRSGRVVAVQGKDMTACALQRGDCMMLDYRTLHAGLPNRSGQARPIVYMVYGRRWFFDDVNYINRIPLDMPLEHYYRASRNRSTAPGAGILLRDADALARGRPAGATSMILRRRDEIRGATGFEVRIWPQLAPELPMDWIVHVAAGETAGGGLAPETEAAAHAAFREHGCVLLRGMFPPAAIEAMHREYLAQFGTLDMAAMGTEAEQPGPNRFFSA